jgi:hypothetical protein
MDVHVTTAPHETVTNLRTAVSGIEAHHLLPSNGAIPLAEVQRRVTEALVHTRSSVIAWRTISHDSASPHRLRVYATPLSVRSSVRIRAVHASCAI